MSTAEPGSTAAAPTAPCPSSATSQPVTCVLLHHKFTPDAIDDFAEVVERGSHFNGSENYRAMTENAIFGYGMDLRYEGSRRFEGSQALVDGGYMLDPRQLGRNRLR